MRHLFDQVRLHIAETLIRWPVDIMPIHHPGNTIIFTAGDLVFSRHASK